MIYSRALKLPAFAAAAQAKTVPSALTTAEAERQAHDMLGRRAGHASRNSGIWSNAVRTRRREIMTNPRPQCSSDALQAAWDRWAMGNVGYRASHGTFDSLLVRAAHALAEQGGVWLQKLQTNGSPNGLRFQLWPDSHRERTQESGREDGIAYTADGDIESVIFRATSSSAAEVNRSRTTLRGRNLFWLRYALDAGQIGGVSPGVQALESDEMLRQFNVNALESARTRAALTFIVEEERGNIRGSNALVGGSPSFTDAQGRTLRTVVPGTVAHAWNGAKVKTPDLDTPLDLSRQFERQIAAGTGYARELIGGEVGDANFSALRQARNTAAEDGIEVRDLCGWFAMLRWITEAWIAAEELEGRSRWTLDDFTWLPRNQLPIDRLKEVEADEKLEQMGVVSRQELIRARGRNPRDVASERKLDVAMGLATDGERSAQPRGENKRVLSVV